MEGKTDIFNFMSEAGHAEPSAKRGGTKEKDGPRSRRVELLGQTAPRQSRGVPKGRAGQMGEAVSVVFSFQYYKQQSLEAGKECSSRADQFLYVTCVFHHFFINDDERDVLLLTLSLQFRQNSGKHSAAI